MKHSLSHSINLAYGAVKLLAIFSATTCVLTGCNGLLTKHVEYEVVQPAKYPVLNAVGYASIAAQSSDSDHGKMLMAMKVSKLEAYRELAEQVYGQQVEGRQTLAQLALQNDELAASVEGVIRGARVVKAYPVGDDTYVTELSLDMEEVYALYLSVARPTRLKDVRYY